jgi:hypothetical protein
MFPAMRTPGHALRPIELVVGGILIVLAVVTCWQLFIEVWLGLHPFASTPGVRDLNPMACLSVPADSAIASSAEAGHFSITGLSLARHAFVEVDRVSLCHTNSSALVRLEAAAYPLMHQVLLVAACALVLRLVRVARRRGLFSRPTAHATYLLGWFLIGGALVGPLLAACVRWVFLHQLVHEASLWHSLRHPGFVWTLLLVGVGVISVARVVRVAVPLQEEAALTV